MTVLLPSSVASANIPLLLAAVAAVAVYALAHPKWRQLPCLERLARTAPRRSFFLWLLLSMACVLLTLGVLLEVYHANGCPNSARFQLEIDSLARWLYDFCGRQRLPYWAMFGNVLFVLRGDARIPVGDTDSDIAMDKTTFRNYFGSVDNFTQQAMVDASLELHTKVHLVYWAERELIQIYLTPELEGSHADIWLYRREGVDLVTGAPLWLVNEDRTIRAKRLPFDTVMPLREREFFFVGTHVSMPRDPAFLAKAEYGASFMTPLVTRLECMENVWNGYTFYHTPFRRQRVIGFVLCASATLALLLAYVCAPLNRQLLQSAAKKRRASYDREDRDADEIDDRHHILDRDLA